MSKMKYIADVSRRNRRHNIWLAILLNHLPHITQPWYVNDQCCDIASIDARPSVCSVCRGGGWRPRDIYSSGARAAADSEK